MKFWLAVWFPAMLALAVIAIESTPMMGADHTSHWLRPVWSRLFGSVDDSTWDVLHWRIRKTGHFIGYGCVSLLFFLSWFRTLREKLAVTRAGCYLRASALALLSTVVIASSDELHQHFLPNRTGSLHDVVLDTIGAMAVQMVVLVGSRIGATAEV